MRLLFFSAAILLVFSGCADSVDVSLVAPHEEVGFWYGLWHGMIAWIAFLVSLFDDSVAVYAMYNTGGWYDFGFLLGFGLVWGSGCKMQCKPAWRKQRDREWEDISNKVEAKVMRNLKDWADDENGMETDEEWDEIAKKVEAKLKRKIRDWAEKE